MLKFFLIKKSSILSHYIFNSFSQVQPYKIESQHYTNIPDNLFVSIGFDEKKIKNLSKNAKLSTKIVELLQQTDLSKCNQQKANLIYNFALKITPTIELNSTKLINYIIEDKIHSISHLEQVINQIKSDICKKGQVDWDNLEKNLSLDYNISEKEVEQTIESTLKNMKTCKNQEMCIILRNLRSKLPGVDPQKIFSIFNEKIKCIKESFCIKEEKNEKKETETKSQNHIWDKLIDLNARDLFEASNTPENYKKHIEITKGKVYLRFPPEPNGYLHIGHAKAMRTNFYSAEKLDGFCNLRYDDTNPEKESIEFIDSIKENINWLGYNPSKITYASDYFNMIYDQALILIKNGKAYVCEQPIEEMRLFRKLKKPSPFRDRSIDENLKLFKMMEIGEFKENEACLRLKIDYSHSNPTMRDPVAYRIKLHPHPKTKRNWNIYPTYDFTHCISDSIENISHSLCTLEFEIRRDLYYWILDALNIFKPAVWEYSRLNISRTILSKRKLKMLVEKKLVNGWDDPRLLTLNGLKRRGYTPNSINEFCDLINVTRRGNENIISIQLLEHCLRKELDICSERTMAVIDPIEVIIENFDSNYMKEISIPIFPRDPTKGTRKIIMTNRIYIDRNDIRNQQMKNFFGVCQDGMVCFKYFGYVSCKKINLDNEGNIKQIIVNFKEEVHSDNKKKCKGILHWISDKESIDCEIRVYDYLFKIDEPNLIEDFMKEINENSLKVYKNAKIHKDLLFQRKERKHYQFERLGYFIEDYDSNENKLIFNMSVSLNEKEKIKTCEKAEIH